MISNKPFHVLRGGVAVTLGFILFRQKKLSSHSSFTMIPKIESFYQAWNNVFEIHF